MTADEKLGFQQRCRERWERAQSSLNRTNGATWRPVMTEQQKREQDEYIKLHNLPF